ncbi:MAG: ligand-binding sensor domain-containing protein, partial [Paludibacter sp.]
MKKHILFIILVSLFPWGITNAIQNAYFEHLKVSNGLSHYSVNSLYQDEHGLIWIGTRDGLNRYDGNEITVYKQKKGDSTALFGNNIRSVCGDKNGHLFMQCKSGVLVFDLKTEMFKTIRRQDVSAIAYGKENLWFCSSDSLFTYQPTAEKPLQLYKLLSDKSIRASALLETNDRLLYVATNYNGVMVYDRNRKIVKRWNITDVISFYEDSKKTVWVCTRFTGLFKIDFAGNITSYQNKPSDPESLPDNFVRTVCEDDFGNYWIGLFSGLCKLNSEKEKFTVFRYERQISHGLSNASVWAIINDAQGTLWIGTYFGGIDLYNPKYSIFNYYGSYSNTPNSLSSPVVGRIIGDKNGNLWIGTDGGGINFYNRKTQNIQSIKSNGTQRGLSSNYIKSLWIDEKLVLITKDLMENVFDYDPLVIEINRLAGDGHYETQERLMTR